MPSDPVHRTARRRARAEVIDAIKDEARRQLGVVGAQALSLRAVARELGMVSSALYRYFPSRDELITALIVDAYDGIGQAAEEASAAEEVPRGRWTRSCHAIRSWAGRHPHEYTLIYGSPIPGYQAPQDTISPAARAPMTLMRILADAHERDLLEARTGESAPPDRLRRQLAELSARLDIPVPEDALNKGLIAWTQLSGMIGFELTGQFVGSVDPADDFFAHAVERMADFIGLRPGP